MNALMQIRGFVFAQGATSGSLLAHDGLTPDLASLIQASGNVPFSDSIPAAYLLQKADKV